MSNFVGLLLVLLVASVAALRYHAHDRVAVVANTVGPFNNPTETYPVCKYPHLLLIQCLILVYYLSSTTLCHSVRALVGNVDINKI